MIMQSNLSFFPPSNGLKIRYITLSEIHVLTLSTYHYLTQPPIYHLLVNCAVNNFQFYYTLTKLTKVGIYTDSVIFMPGQ